MPGPNLLQAAGSRPKQETRYAAIYNSRFFVGLWTNRNVLRGPLGAIYSEFYRLGSTDVLADGSNVELTSRLTLARRPGNPPFLSATVSSAPDSFYSFHEITGTVRPIADTPLVVYTFDTSALTPIFNKASGAGQAFFQGVGTTLYIGDAVEQVKWMDGVLAAPTTPSLSSTAAGSLPATTYYVKTTYVNVQGQTIGSAEASLAVAANNVLVVASPPMLSGATGWYPYVSTTTSAETRQVTSPIAIGTSWTEPTSGLIAGMALPPSNTAENITNWGIVAPSTAPALTIQPQSNLTSQNLVSVALNGSSGYVSTANQYSHPWSTTQEILFNTSSGSAQVLFAFEQAQTGTGTSGDHYDHYLWLDSGGHLNFSMADAPAGVWRTVTTSTPLNDGHWHHVAATISRAKAVYLYVDGQQAAYNSYLMGANPQTFNGYWRMGEGGSSSSVPLPPWGGVSYFNGDISHASIWQSNSGDAVLSAGQIYNHYQTLITKGQATYESTVLADNPTFFWKLTETSGTTAADSADSNPGTYQTGFTLDQTSVLYFGAWTALTPVALGTTLIDQNGNLEKVTTNGTTGSTAPAWNVNINGTTPDGSAIWTNQGPAGLSPKSAQGYVYCYSFKNSVTGHVSTASPLSSSSGPGTALYIQLSGQRSTDPQVDTIEIYRSADGGATYLFLADIANPTSGNWSYTDSTPDSGLNPLIPAPVDHANDPPHVGLVNLTYHLGRMWGSVGSSVYASGGPDTDPGNGNEAWPPANVWQFPSQVTRLVPLTSGLLVFTTTDLYIITGGPSITTFYSQILLTGVGLLSYNALEIDGSLIYMFSSDRRLWTLDPSSGLSDIGFPIGDKLSGIDPTKAYVTYHSYGSLDSAIYVADGSTGWYRCNPNQAPDASLSGPVWSPKATIVGGAGAVASIETSPGVHTMLVGSPNTNGNILARDSSFTTFTDNGSAYDAYFVMGSIVLANPGQMAEIGFLTCDFQKVGTVPVLYVLMNEISGTFEQITANTINDPPQLYGPSLSASSVYPIRYNFAPNGAMIPAFCRHLQIKVDFGSDTVQNEILSSTIFGALLQDR